MSIVSATFGLLGQDGVTPRRVQLVVTDGFTTLTTTGYLSNEKLNPNFVYPTDVLDVIYDFSTATNTGTYGQFTPNFSGGVITLVGTSPTNPNIQFTGTFTTNGSFFFGNVGVLTNEGYKSNLLVLNDSAQSNDTTLTTLNLNNVQVIGNTVGYQFSALTSYIANNVLEIVDNFNYTFPALTTFEMTSLKIVVSSFQPSFNVLQTLSLPSLVTARSFQPSINAVTDLNLPLLKSVYQSFYLSAPALTSLSLPSLTDDSGTFHFEGSELLTLDLPILQSTGEFYLQANLLTSVSCPALTTTAPFSIFGNNVASVNLPVLTTITSILQIQSNVLTTLSLPALTEIDGSVTFTTPALTTFSFSSGLLVVGGSVQIIDAALTQASVDSILISLASLDGTGGTTLYSGWVIDLSGGTSAAPSSAAIAAIATLESNGNTVTTN